MIPQAPILGKYRASRGNSARRAIGAPCVVSAASVGLGLNLAGPRAVPTRSGPGRTGCRFPLEPGQIAGGLVGTGAAHLEGRTQRTADRRAIRCAKQGAKVLRRQMRAAHAGGFAVRQTRDGRGDGDFDAAGAASRSAVHPFHPIFPVARSDMLRRSVMSGMSPSTPSAIQSMETISSCVATSPSSTRSMPERS